VTYIIYTCINSSVPVYKLDRMKYVKADMNYRWTCWWWNIMWCWFFQTHRTLKVDFKVLVIKDVILQLLNPKFYRNK